jgi:hypothetical protein
VGLLSFSPEAALVESLLSTIPPDKRTVYRHHLLAEGLNLRLFFRIGHRNLVIAHASLEAREDSIFSALEYSVHERISDS